MKMNADSRDAVIHMNQTVEEKALEEGKISKIRYDNYVNIYTELKEKRKW